MNGFFNKILKHWCRYLIIAILLILALAWGFNNLKLKCHLQDEVSAQEEQQITWQMQNIAAWTCGAIRSTDTVVVITPEFYEDVFNSEKIAAYNVDQRANYVLTAFKRSFNDPFSVANDVSALTKELRKTYSRIIIVGHSKSSTINIAMLEYLSNVDYDYMVNISATYSGTPLTMPEKIYEILAPKKILFWNYGKQLYDFYFGIFDGDMADKIIREDSEFLKQLDYSKINKNKFINITAKSGFKSFMYDFWNFDSEGIGLPFLDCILNLNGDGIVPLKSQKSHMDDEITAISISASHKSSYKIGVKKALDIIDKCDTKTAGSFPCHLFLFILKLICT